MKKTRVLWYAFLLLAALALALPGNANAACSANITCWDLTPLSCTGSGAVSACGSDANSVYCDNTLLQCAPRCTASLQCQGGTTISCQSYTPGSCQQGNFSIKCGNDITYCPECTSTWWFTCPVEFL